MFLYRSCFLFKKGRGNSLFRSTIPLIVALLLGFDPSFAKSRENPKPRAPAQSQLQCIHKPWKHDRKLPIQEIKIILDSLPRYEVIQIAWREVLRPQADSVALPLLVYLSRTEENKYVKGYFEWLSLAAFNDHDFDKELSRWPIRKTPKLTGASLHDLCAMYRQARD